MTRILLFVLALSFAGSAMGQTPLGFRTDGTGRYPDATPPLYWGTDKNVVWKINLTQSNAIPVILGQKLFTCAEPCVLLGPKGLEPLHRKPRAADRKVPPQAPIVGEVDVAR